MKPKAPFHVVLMLDNTDQVTLAENVPTLMAARMIQGQFSINCIDTWLELESELKLPALITDVVIFENGGEEVE